MFKQFYDLSLNNVGSGLFGPDLEVPNCFSNTVKNSFLSHFWTCSQSSILVKEVSTASGYVAPKLCGKEWGEQRKAKVQSLHIELTNNILTLLWLQSSAKRNGGEQRRAKVQSLHIELTNNILALLWLQSSAERNGGEQRRAKVQSLHIQLTNNF